MENRNPFHTHLIMSFLLICSFFAFPIKSPTPDSASFCSQPISCYFLLMAEEGLMAKGGLMSDAVKGELGLER